MTDLEEIIAAHGSALARVAASYEADPALQEDLMQDMLIAIHGALPKLREADRIKPFIFRVAHNRGVTHVMRQAAHRKRDQSLIGEEETSETPEQMLLADERSRLVTQAVRRLPLPYRQVMTLILEDLSYAEIGEALGLSISNVGVRVNRAKAQLKAILDGK